MYVAVVDILIAVPSMSGMVEKGGERLSRFSEDTNTRSRGLRSEIGALFTYFSVDEVKSISAH